MARTQDDTRTPVNWAFIHDVNGKDAWTWRRLKFDGSIALTSSRLSDFGAAVSDALNHGFRPQEHHWMVQNNNWTTHFHPGATPILVPPDSQAVKPTNGSTRVPASTKQETQRAD